MTARKALTALGAAVLVAALVLPDGKVSAAILLVCMALSILILWRNLPQLSDLPEDHPKVEVLRRVTAGNVALVAVILLLAWAGETGRLAALPPTVTRWLLTGLFAGIILIFGNVAPKLPCTRHTGLRLPWTVRDEQTWLVAHRMLGWLSLPFGLMAVAAGAIPQLELAVKGLVGVLLGWVAIPSVLSLVFYWRKFRRQK